MRATVKGKIVDDAADDDDDNDEAAFEVIVAEEFLLVATDNADEDADVVTCKDLEEVLLLLLVVLDEFNAVATVVRLLPFLDRDDAVVTRAFCTVSFKVLRNDGGRVEPLELFKE